MTEHGNHLYAATPGNHLKKICNELDITEITLHGLRHSYTTRLFEENVAIKTVQILMSHSKVGATLDIYTHVMPEIKMDAADALNEVFFKQSMNILQLRKPQKALLKQKGKKGERA